MINEELRLFILEGTRILPEETSGNLIEAA